LGSGRFRSHKSKPFFLREGANFGSRLSRFCAKLLPMTAELQTISDAQGRVTGVIVPIDLWREIESEKETAYLLGNPETRRRLLEAKERDGGMTLEEVRAEIGI